MTERIYYRDPYATEFEATVVAAEEIDGRVVVVLDRTAFYPTSGGQPFDTGTLAGVPVVEVLDRQDGSVGHVLERPLATGGTVHGRIDWAPRFDHMQQHTGQHLLSAAFDRLYGARTVGFHLGAGMSTIDLDRDLPAEALAAAEEEANRIVWENRPVMIRVASPEEAARLPLRKEPQREGPLRLIEVAGFDVSACGGTHVAATGAVGIVAITAWERFRGGLRLEFLCGGRALHKLRSLGEAVGGSLRVLSVAPGELPAAIDRAQAENRDLRRAVRTLTERLAGYEAGALFARGERVGLVTRVVEVVEGWDANGLKALATSIAQRPGCVAVLISAPAPSLIAIARAGDVPVDAAALLKALTVRFGGKGGGRPDLAQGGGLAGPPDAIAAAARERLAQLRSAPDGTHA